MKTSILMMAVVLALFALPGTAGDPDPVREPVRVTFDEIHILGDDPIPIGVRHDASCGGFALAEDESCTVQLPGLHCCVLQPWMEVDFGFTGRVTIYAETETGWFEATCFFDLAGVTTAQCDEPTGNYAFYFGQDMTITVTASAIPVGGYAGGVTNS